MYAGQSRVTNALYPRIAFTLSSPEAETSGFSRE